MKILVYGAGAIGSFLGGRLTLAGENVTLVARGAHLDALTRRGLILEGTRSGAAEPIPVRVCQPGEEQGPYDLIFVTLKSHQIEAVAPRLSNLVARDGALVFPQNGVPWWYFQGVPSAWRDTSITVLDPRGVLRRSFPPQMIIGGTAVKPCDVIAPGHVRVAEGSADALTIGEIDNQITPRVKAIADLVTGAGWPGKASEDIRKVKWGKLLSNAVWNTLGAITQCTPSEVARDPGARGLTVALMREVIGVAGAVGTQIAIDAEARVDQVARGGTLPTSTLQDVRAGRPLEIDAIINAVVELGRLTLTPTPSLDAVAACINLLNLRIVESRVAIRPIPLD